MCSDGHGRVALDVLWQARCVVVTTCRNGKPEKRVAPYAIGRLPASPILGVAQAVMIRRRRSQMTSQGG